MNKRANACPKCLPFVGKILIDDVLSGGKASDGPYTLMSSAMAAGLYHTNCKDVYTTYFPELDDGPDSKFSKKDLEQVKEDYRQDQKRQYAGRMVEQFDKLSKYSLDSDNQKMYSDKKEQWEKVANQKDVLTDEDTKMLYEYISSKSYVINEKLRNGAKLSYEEKKMVDRLNKTLDKMPKYNGNLQRSVYIKFEEDIEKYVKQFEVDKIINTKQFLSTTKGQVYNEDGQIQIYI